jgi:hypothetical protein
VVSCAYSSSFSRGWDWSIPWLEVQDQAGWHSNTSVKKDKPKWFIFVLLFKLHRAFCHNLIILFERDKSEDILLSQLRNMVISLFTSTYPHSLSQWLYFGIYNFRNQKIEKKIMYSYSVWYNFCWLKIEGNVNMIKNWAVFIWFVYEKYSVISMRKRYKANKYPCDVHYEDNSL